MSAGNDCTHEESSVVESRRREVGVYRRRRCDACKALFSTRELSNDIYESMMKELLKLRGREAALREVLRQFEVPS